MESKEEQLSDKVINEEYKIWKKHSPFLYDICLVKALQWPSLTLDWLRAPTLEHPRDFMTSCLLLSSVVADYDSTDYIYKALVDLPLSSDQEATKLHNFLDEGQKITHDGPVVCARASPVNSALIAAMGQKPGLSVYDTSDFPTSLPAQDGTAAKPTKELKFHEKGGRYLAWHLTDASRLASSDFDSNIALWDWTQSDTPLNVYRGDTIYNEVQYKDEQLLGAIGEDGTFELIDLRDPERPAYRISAHEAPGTSLSFNQKETSLVATASANGAVKVWDFRFLKKPKHSLRSDTQQVRSVRWSPHQAPVLASGGDDRRVKIWDLSLANTEQSHEEENEGPPELIFIHGGHIARINALEWHPSIPWVIASASEDNIVQVWQPASSIVNATAEADTEAGTEAE